MLISLVINGNTWLTNSHKVVPTLLLLLHFTCVMSEDLFVIKLISSHWTITVHFTIFPRSTAIYTFTSFSLVAQFCVACNFILLRFFPSFVLLQTSAESQYHIFSVFVEHVNNSDVLWILQYILLYLCCIIQLISKILMAYFIDSNPFLQNACQDRSFAQDYISAKNSFFPHCTML